MDFMDFSRRLYRWASEGVDMYGGGGGDPPNKLTSQTRARLSYTLV